MKKCKQEIKSQGLSCQMQYGITRRKEKTMKNDLLECLVYLAMLLVGFAVGVITTSFYFHNALDELGL